MKSAWNRSPCPRNCRQGGERATVVLSFSSCIGKVEHWGGEKVQELKEGKSKGTGKTYAKLALHPQRLVHHRSSVNEGIKGGLPCWDEV